DDAPGDLPATGTILIPLASPHGKEAGLTAQTARKMMCCGKGPRLGSSLSHMASSRPARCARSSCSVIPLRRVDEGSSSSRSSSGNATSSSWSSSPTLCE
ncbi:hypothetical protein Vretimale_3825, partial [Volvox reticuliferus]